MKTQLAETPSELHTQIATRLRQARIGSGLTQSDAARIIGVTYQQYNKYELGMNRVSAVTLYRLAVAFDVSDIGWFFRADNCASVPPKTENFTKLLHLLAEIEDRADQKLLLAIMSRLVAAKHGHLPAPNPTESKTDTTLAPRGKHVLLVDDDPDGLRMTETFLLKAGLRVTAALNGDEALVQMATGGTFDALVTDYAMPGLSGLALIDLAQELLPNLPLLVVTGYSRDIDLLTGLPPHVQVLVKPFSRNVLLEAIAQMVGP